VGELKGVEERVRGGMIAAVEAKQKTPFKDLVRREVEALTNVSESTRKQFAGIIDKLPIAYSNVPAIFRSVEKKTPGQGGLFSIFVSDLCKGCGECVQVCGEHDALRMTVETEELNADLRPRRFSHACSLTHPKNILAFTMTRFHKTPGSGLAQSLDGA
jgi:pyruvate-ferredoxin/flavodoxin oxidoreductase